MPGSSIILLKVSNLFVLPLINTIQLFSKLNEITFLLLSVANCQQSPSPQLTSCSPIYSDLYSLCIYFVQFSSNEVSNLHFSFLSATPTSVYLPLVFRLPTTLSFFYNPLLRKFLSSFPIVLWLNVSLILFLLRFSMNMLLFDSPLSLTLLTVGVGRSQFEVCTNGTDTFRSFSQLLPNFTDPRGIDGLVDPSAPRIEPRH